MDFEEQFRILESARGNPALLALATVDFAHGDVSQADRRSVKDALVAAAVPHWCDPPLLAALLGTSVDVADRLLASLGPLTVVEPFAARGAQAVNVHETARLALREHLRTTDPERWTLYAQRARDHLLSNPAPHARIEALFHLFAIDPAAAAADCEKLDRMLAGQGRPEVRHGLAVALRELTKAGWLTGAAQIEALLAPLEVRSWRGETAQLEDETRAVLDLARAASYTTGVVRSLCLLSDALTAKGQLDASLVACLESLARSRQLADAEPHVADRQRDLANIWLRVGTLNESQGRLDEALASYQASLDISRSIATSDPTNRDGQRELVNALMMFGSIYEAQGRLDAALDEYQEALDICRQSVIADPSNMDLVRETGIAHSRIGGVCELQGRFDEALVAYEADLGISQRLLESDPSNAGFKHGLAIAHLRMGSLRESQERLDAALDIFGEALVLLKELAKSDPFSAIWQRDANNVLDRIARIYEVQQRYDEALAVFRDCLESGQRMVDAIPTNLSWRRDLAIAYDRIGNFLNNRGRLDEALHYLKESLSISREIAAAEPNNAGWRRDLAIANDRIGNYHQSQGNIAEALIYFNEYLALSQALANDAPTNIGWQRDLGVAYDRIGRAYDEQGRPDAAMAAFEAGIALIEPLGASRPFDVALQRDLGIGYDRVGGLHEKAGRDDEALQAYLAALRAVEGLAPQRPTDANWQADLGLANERVGKIHHDQKRFEQALASYTAALDARRAAAGIEPTNFARKRQLVSVLTIIAELQASLGRTDASLGALTEVVDHLHRMSQGETTPADLTRLSDAYEELGKVHRLLQRDDDALQAFETAIALVEPLSGSVPADEALLRQLYDAQEVLGGFHRERGDLTATSRVAAGSLRTLLLLRAHDDSEAVRKELDVAWDRVGKLYEAEERFDEALEAFRASLVLSQQAVDEQPDARSLLNLSVAREGVGRLLGTLGHDDDATASLEASLVALRQAAALAPDDFKMQAYVREALVRFGIFHEDHERWAEALDAYEEALASVDRLDDPAAADADGELALWCVRAARILESQQRFDEALRRYDLARQRVAHGLVDDPSNAGRLRDLATLDGLIGRAQHAIGDAVAAERSFRTAVETLERALQAHPGDPDLTADLAAARMQAA